MPGRGEAAQREEKFRCLRAAASLFCNRDSIKQHQTGHSYRHQGGEPPHQCVHQDQSGGKKVQPGHHAAFIDPVGHCSADGRQNHHGQEGAGGDHPEQRGGTGLPQQIEREGKVEDGVAEQRDNLPMTTRVKSREKTCCFIEYLLNINRPTVCIWAG